MKLTGCHKILCVFFLTASLNTKGLDHILIDKTIKLLYRGYPLTYNLWIPKILPSFVTSEGAFPHMLLETCQTWHRKHS